MKSTGWFKQWFRDAFAASSRKEFYRRIEERTPGQAIGHVAMLTTLLWVLPFLVMFFIGMNQGIKTLREELRTNVPAGTTFEIQNGKFTNNLSAPIIRRSDDGTMRLVVNTATTTIDLEPGIDGVVINADSITIQEENRRNTTPVSSMPAFKLSREEIETYVNRWAPAVLFFGSIIACLLVFGIFLAGFLISAFVHAFALWLAFKLFKRVWPWKRAFVASAYAATLPIALGALIADGSQFDPLPALLYWAIIAWIVYDTITRSRNLTEKVASDTQPPVTG